MGRWWSHRVVRALALLTLLTVVGTGGYMIIEGWGLADALFMAVVILSTVGLEAPHALSAAGRAFTIVLIVTGVSVAAYIVSTIGEYVTGGVLTGAFRQRRQARSIEQLTSHYIVCGYGRVGRQIVEDLRRRGCSVVIVEPAPNTPHGADDEVGLITGDATDDGVLTRAGVGRARGLVAATGSDATNLVIVLSARALAPDLIIVSRASDTAAEPKLARAGATHVVSPYAIGGHRVVAELLSPAVTAFLDSVMHSEQLDLWLEVSTVAPASPLVGRTLAEALPAAHHTVNVVALQREPGGTFITNPAPDTRLAAGDTLIALGPQDAIQAFGARATGVASDGKRTGGRRRAPRPRPVA